MVVGPDGVFICDECAILSVDIISSQSLNLRVAYFSFVLVAKLLYPLSWLADQVRIAKRPRKPTDQR